MSDPMRPPSGPLSSTQLALAIAPDFYYTPSELHKRFIASGRTLPELKKRLDRLAMEPKASVLLYRSLHSKDSVRSATTDKMATCVSGPGVGRTRSAIAKGFVNAGFSQLPVSHQYAAYDEVAAAIGNTCRWENMGPEMALGRLVKYFPKKNSPPVLRPPTEEEAQRALADCGLVMLPPVTNTAFYAPYPMRPTYEGERAIRVSKRSYNGLPTEGSSDEPAAMDLAHQVAVSVRRQLEVHYGREGMEGVDRWVRRQRVQRPYLTTLIGRAKDDCYTTEKYDTMMVRFYTVWPRPLLMVIQQASQPLADAAQSALEDAGLHSMCGVSLAHGGAERVVNTLQEQLETEGFAFLVMGDDSWVVLQIEWKGEPLVVMLALDCSAFDLTQRGLVREELLVAIAKQMELFDGVSAGLWLSLMRERDVVVMQSLVETMKDGGPSGGPCQSEINSGLMSIGIRRGVSAVTREAFSDTSGTGDGGSRRPPSVRIRAIFEEAMKGLGFVVKVEQYYESRELQIKEILREKPFLFLGYYFHVIGDTVAPFCDLKRTLATTAYPSGGAIKDKRVFNVLEAYRIGGAVISMGVPPLELSAAYEAMRADAITTLRALIMDGKEVDLEEYPDYSAGGVLWPYVPTSLLGVHNALLKRPEQLWLMAPPPPPLPESSPLMEVMDAFNWGDQMDQEDRAEAELLGGNRPDGSVPDPRPRALESLAQPIEPSRGVTPGSHGRPPPQAARREGVSRPSPHVLSQARVRVPVLSNAELVAQAFEEAEADETGEAEEVYYDEFFPGSEDGEGRARGESMGSDEGFDALWAGVHHTAR